MRLILCLNWSDSPPDKTCSPWKAWVPWKNSHGRGHGHSFLSCPHSPAQSCSHFLLKGSMEPPGSPIQREANLFPKLAARVTHPSFPKAGGGGNRNLVFSSLASWKRGSQAHPSFSPPQAKDERVKEKQKRKQFWAPAGRGLTSRQTEFG